LSCNPQELPRHLKELYFLPISDTRGELRGRIAGTARGTRVN
jgi:hypothetical protein